jgi:hypothetical protein
MIRFWKSGLLSANGCADGRRDADFDKKKETQAAVTRLTIYHETITRMSSLLQIWNVKKQMVFWGIFKNIIHRNNLLPLRVCTMGYHVYNAIC